MVSKLLLEYVVPDLYTKDFHDIRSKDEKGSVLPSGICPVCKERHSVARKHKFPNMCPNCFAKLKIYQNLNKDVLSLKTKDVLTLKDAIRIVKYVEKYTKRNKRLVYLLSYFFIKTYFLKK